MCGPSESAGALLEEFWLDDKPKAWRVTGTEGVEMVRFGTGNRDSGAGFQIRKRCPRKRGTWCVRGLNPPTLQRLSYIR